MKLSIFLVFFLSFFVIQTLAKDAPLVSVELYFESLCPYCREFITGTMKDTWAADGLQSILNLTLVPYGNARRQCSASSCSFTCQHGPDECVGNLIESCAIALYPRSQHIPFLICLESGTVTKDGAACASQNGMNWTLTNACATGPKGNQLERQNGEITDRLNPPHQYVPWIVLNGVHTEDINREAQDDLLSLVCKTYTGTKPSGCPSSKLRVSWKDEVKVLMSN